MEVQLTEVDASKPIRTIILDKLPVMIGQSPDAAIRLEDHWVSRQHCEINTVKGTLVVRDLGSMLGTFVNGLNVATALLMPGDKLTVGVTSFLVDYERPRVTRVPATVKREPVGAEVGEPAEEEPRPGATRLLFFRLPRRLLPSVWKRWFRRRGGDNGRGRKPQSRANSRPPL